MKAIRIHEPGGADVLRYEDVPDPSAGAGQVLVKVEAIGVNFAETMRRGQGQVPQIPGGEAAGVVQAVGEGVSGFAAGDRVVVSGGGSGTYAEMTAVPEARVFKIPDNISTKQAASVFNQGITAHYLATDTYPLGPNDTCLVHSAAGGVGLLLCQIAKMRGARVIGTVSTEEKAQAAREAGADEVINYATEDFAEEARRLTDGRGVDVVYDAVGKTTLHKGLTCIRRRGLMVQYGQASGQADPIDTAVLGNNHSIMLTRTHLVDHTTSREETERRANDIFSWVASGKLKARVFAEFPLKDAADAQRAIESRATIGKVLIIP